MLFLLLTGVYYPEGRNGEGTLPHEVGSGRKLPHGYPKASTGERGARLGSAQLLSIEAGA